MSNGIPTAYAGVQFRSRIEARWARFFDALGWQWDYEPFDLHGYIPDFIMSLKEPMLVEVKSATTLSELKQHEEKLNRSGWDKEILVVGGAVPIKTDGPSTSLFTIGWHRDTRWGGVAPGQTWWAPALLMRCIAGHEHIGLNSDEASYECRVCGAHDGDGHFTNLRAAEATYLSQSWANAGNAVQWRPSESRTRSPWHVDWSVRF